MTGIVFDIQRYSIHDGPGIRTLVFLKGCPLTCKWCCNPEGQKSQPEIRFLETKCVAEEKCKAPCLKACPNGAISLNEAGKPKTDTEICRSRGECAEVCYYGARVLSGKSMTVEELLSEVRKDEPFYRNSSGGVSVGGGEPMVQFEFTREFLKRCKEHSLHTTLETCGHVPWEHLRAVLEYVDLVYYDIKHMNPLKHKELVGVSNDLILRNARYVLSSNNTEVIIRIPIIPGLNDFEENIKATASFVAESGGKMMELLPYHRLGVSKYRQFSRKYELKDIEPPTKEQMQMLRRLVKSSGIKEVTGAI